MKSHFINFSRRRLFHVFFLSLLVILCSLEAKQAPQIRALITVDTKSNLRNSVIEDAKKMNLLLGALSDIGIPVIKKELQESELTVENIRDWIRSIPAESNDIILFYFSGHGIRTKEIRSPFPILALQQGEQFVESSVIKQALSRKKARLILIITDCCNGFLLPKRFFTPTTSFKHNNEYNKNLVENLRSLFLKTKGQLIATAAKPGTNAIGFVPIGGLFTNMLIKSMVSLGEKKNQANWKMILSETKQGCKAFSQEPYYEIKVSMKK